MRHIIQWFKNLELARKLILINCILIVIPLSVISIFAYSSFTRTMEQNVGDYQLQTLKQLTLNIDTYMNELNRLSLMPYQYDEIMEYLGSEREQGQPLTLEEIDQLNSFVSRVFINGRVDIMGVSLYGENGASYVVLPESQYVTSYKLDDTADWLKKIEGQFGKPIFIPTHEVKSTSGMTYKVFSIAREFRSFDTGKKLGYIVIDIDPKGIHQIMSQVTMGAEESLFITDANGDMVIRKGHIEIPTNMNTVQGEGVSHMTVSGNRMLSAYVTSQVTGWTTIGIVPVSILMKDSVVVRNSIMLIGALCIGLAIIFSVIIAFRISLPLRKLRSLMRKVEDGNLKASFKVEHWDEVGHLGNAFNTMVSKLSELGYLLYETEIREKDAQISALQSKINPHFLYNTLGSISMYAEVEGNREVVTMTNNLSRLLRYSLSDRREDVTLRDELAHVQGYMTIQKMRYEERIHFHLDIEESVLDCKVIPLLIQPIVENAINHGLDKGVGDGNIRLSSNQHQSVLSIIVEDDGVGLSNEQLEMLRHHLKYTRDLGGKTGNGLLNVHRRILLHYGETYGLTLESMPFRGLKVIVTMPAELPVLDVDKEARHA